MLLLTISLAGCSLLGSSKVKPFFCPVEAAYDEQGKMDKSSVRVKINCAEGLQKRIKACYDE